MAAISCNYKKPVVFPDTVQVGSKVERIGTSSFVMSHHVVSLKEQAIVADGSSTIVLFDYAIGKSKPLPESVRRRIAAMEGKSIAP